MVAEQAGPRGRIVLLRNTVEGRTFCSTAQKSQAVLPRFPVVYLDHAYRHLESASSDPELALLLVLRSTRRGAPSGSTETATVRAAVDALREAVDGADPACRKDGAAAAWYAEPVLRFLCATFGCGVADAQVAEEGFIVATAEIAGDGLVEVSITVGPEGTCACRVSVGDAHMAATAADARLFETVLAERMAQTGLFASGGSRR